MEQDRLIRVLLAERAKLLAYAWSIVRDEHAAEDIFQEVMLLAIQKRHQIQNEQALMAWSRTATRYRSLHALRDRKKTPQPLGDGLLDALDQCWQQRDQTPATEMVDALADCVEELTPYARQVVALRYGDGLSGGEVADALNRNVRTIYMALTRIHNALRDCIRSRLADET